MIKALIVEDEEWVRLGLREMIDWSSLGIAVVGECQNGADAIEVMERTNIDIVITDIRMPKMDGIALMEYIHTNFPNILTIVISGYSEFEYARKAIAYNAFGYVLKPIEEKELELLLKDAACKLREDKVRQKEFIELKAISSENCMLEKEIFLSRLIRNSNMSMDDMHKGIEMTGLSSNSSKMAIMVIRRENTGSIHQRVEACLWGHTEYMLFRNHSRQDELVIIAKLAPGSDADIKAVVLYMANSITSAINPCMDGNVNIGIGREFIKISDAYISYEQAVEAIHDAGMISSQGIIHIDDVRSRNDYFIYPNDKEKTFLYYLENGCRPQLFEMIDELFGEVEKSTTVNPQSIRDTVLELTISISKVLKKYGWLMKDLLNERNIPEKIINEILTIDELKQWLKEAAIKVMDSIKSSKRTGTKKTLEDIVEYMKGHYNEDIGLNSVAGMFYLNPAYLSRVFKSETGHNFNDYLNKIRLDAAALLINDANLKLSDVSSIVGYENTNYFLKKFKEHFGYTPTEYRKNSRTM